MGHNRSGVTRKNRLKRRKKEMNRLVAKAAHEESSGGVVASVKSMAKTAAHAVTDAVKAATDKVKKAIS